MFDTLKRGLPELKRLISGVLGALALVSAAVAVEPARAQAPLLDNPNILIIVTDDQRTGMMGVMPETRQRFGAEGVTYPKGFVTTPLCCPSRTSIFTGQYAHNHGILKNSRAPQFDHNETIERYLQDAGYRTAISGKFLNSWPLDIDPPFFEKFSIFRSGYYGTMFNVDGQVRSVEEYTTDFVGAQAISYIEEFETAGAQPWFLQISPGAPHKPFTAAERHRGLPVKEWRKTKAVREADRRSTRMDKPRWVRQRSTSDRRSARIYEKQQRTLMAVDELVGDVFNKLEELGEADNTLAFYISDNGYLHGEHGLTGKRFPYLDSIRVPFYARWPERIPGGTVDDRFALNIDITPTIVEVVDVVDVPAAPEPLPVDGISLFGDVEHEYVFTEQWGNPNKGLPDWASILTDDFQFIQYYIANSGGYPLEREYYNLRTDPWQLQNTFGDGVTRNNPRDSGALKAVLRRFRTCAGETCRP